MRHQAIAAVFATLMSFGLITAPAFAQESEVPVLSFADRTPFNFNASALDVTSLYEAPGVDPNIDHLMPLSPEQAALQWAQDRIRTVGTNDLTVRFLVNDAAVIQRPLPVKGGFTGFFTTEQAEEYFGSLSVSIELVDSKRKVLASVRGSAKANQTVPENVSLADREKLWFQLTERMMNELNTQLEESINVYFRDHLLH
ncbi:MAG: hypothetical protein A2516_08085 [Alphaproteobacteria bacterium RIFOXYD12_FULL_60_8]|nr:MAG: hypothetical protein A2516_08085 [Alphaproteobacteria bacterium RIFOXYD12_FULL_60_8]